MKKPRTITLTETEVQATLSAISQMTSGNANDFNEWRKQTSGTASEWHALRRVERKLKEISEPDAPLSERDQWDYDLVSGPRG